MADLRRNDIAAAVAWARANAPIRPETWSSLVRLQDTPEAIVAALRQLDEELGGKLIRPPALGPRLGPPVPQIAPAPSIIEPAARAWLEQQKDGLWLQSEFRRHRTMPIVDWHIDPDGFHFWEAGDYDGRRHVWELRGVAMSGPDELRMTTPQETWSVLSLASILLRHDRVRERVERWRADLRGRPAFGHRQGLIRA